MTKLMEWLSFAVVFLGIWLMVITNKIETSFTKQYPELVLYFPVIAIVLFGLYAATVVLYRVFTFNDCNEAAIELKKEIEEAKADLIKVGFKFKEK